MGALPILVKAEGGRQIKNLSRALKDAGRGDLRRELRSEIKQAGEPVVSDLRAAVQRVQITSTRGGSARPNRSTGLRRRIARATNISITTTGIRIRVSARRVDPKYPKLAKYTDGSVGNYGRWRHPIFGNTDLWTQQSGSPWFFVTINRHRSDFRRAVFDAMEKIRNRIT